jgi:hypothetical protein
MKWTIRKMNELNWQVWEWQDGGETVSRGRYAGQEKQAKWIPLESYHGSLRNAVKWLVNHATRANVESGTDLDTATILAAIEKAEQNVLDAVSTANVGDPN